MNSRLFLIVLFVVGGLIVFGLTRTKPKQNASVKGSVSEDLESSEGSTLSSQEKSFGAVDVEVTPALVFSEEKLVFKLSLNTHSVDLNFDYTKIASLSDDQGNTYLPQDWNGEGGAHHKEGELVFESLPEGVNAITLSLDGIDDQSGTFTWDL